MCLFVVVNSLIIIFHNHNVLSQESIYRNKEYCMDNSHFGLSIIMSSDK